MFQLEEATIASIHGALKTGELTCRQLIEGYLKRIEAYDRKGPALHAIICLNPQALQIADQLDADFRQKGPSGPLHGIPVLLKDNVNTCDMPTTGGSLSLEGYVPPEDAAISKSLRRAGAILLAKANLQEFAAGGETVSSILGQTLNPYDLTRTPGGSSGGTGAGLAANFAVLGIGTDTINSIRSPSSANSIVGIRPTLGLISRAGIIPYSFTQDAAGPMARTLTDAVKMLNVLVGYDPADPDTAWNIGHLQTDYTSFLTPRSLQGLRIGLLKNFLGSEAIHQEVNEVTRRAIKKIHDLGATIIPVGDPALDPEGIASAVNVNLYELQTHLNTYLANPHAGAPLKSLAAIVASGKCHPWVEPKIREALAFDLNAPAYRERLLRRLELRNLVMGVMAENGLEALVYPHQKRLPVPLGQTQVERNGVLAAVTGFPAITVPGGFSRPTPAAPLGVPVGIEFLGRPWSEPVLIRIACSFEQAESFRRPPASAPALS